MPTGSEVVRLSGKTGSDRRTVKMTRLTQLGHRRPVSLVADHRVEPTRNCVMTGYPGRPAVILR